jgi:hypothetical protein
MIFDIYKAQLELIEPMLGTVPKNPDVYAAYVASKAPSPQVAQEEVDLERLREDVEESGWTGFHQDESGRIFIYNYMILGFLKEAGNILKTQLGIANLRSKVDQFVYVQPRRIYLGVTEPDGVLERPLRAMTMQGPRVTVTRSDYVNAGTRIECEIHVLRNKEIGGAVIAELLKFGEFKGLGQWRNGSYGRFKVCALECVSESVAPPAITRAG